jgi:hypothetical protein
MFMHSTIATAIADQHRRDLITRAARPGCLLAVQVARYGLRTIFGSAVADGLLEPKRTPNDAALACGSVRARGSECGGAGAGMADDPIGRAESLLRLPRSRSLIGYVALLEGAPDVV